MLTFNFSIEIDHLSANHINALTAAIQAASEGDLSISGDFGELAELDHQRRLQELAQAGQLWRLPEVTSHSIGLVV